MVSSHDRAPPSLYLRNDFPVSGKVITPTRCESSCVPRPIVQPVRLVSESTLFLFFHTGSTVPYSRLRARSLHASRLVATDFPEFHGFPQPTVPTPAQLLSNMMIVHVQQLAKVFVCLQEVFMNMCYVCYMEHFEISLTIVETDYYNYVGKVWKKSEDVDTQKL